jgi:amidase
MSELAGLDATGQAALVRRGEATPTELVETAIARVEELNPELNAVIHPLFDEGRAAAADSLPDGPFKGVPFLLKDLGAAYAGQPLHMGTRVLKELDFRCPADTYLAQRFRSAGFVTIGKTNTPELGILPTTEPAAYGPSRNPWDTSRSTGGSSGGSAAAVASGMVPIAHANDGGGSIRIPASACGLVGLKPTRQRISEGPLIGDMMSGLTAELVLSRSVRDVAAVLDEVQGAAPGDPYVAPPPGGPYRDEVGADPGRLRIGLTTTSLTDVEADPQVVTAATDAAQLLESLGHDVDEAAPAGLDAAGVGEQLRDSFLTRWMAGQGVALTMLERIAGREIRPEELEPLTWALASEGRTRSAAQYLDAVALHQGVTRAIAAWYESGYDLLLTPTLGEPPPPLGTFDDSVDPMAPIDRARLTVTFTVLLNMSGQPAVSLPLHWSPDGLPIGVQLVAPYGREDVLIRVASQLERARPWADRRPPVFAAATPVSAPPA